MAIFDGKFKIILTLFTLLIILSLQVDTKPVKGIKREKGKKIVVEHGSKRQYEKSLIHQGSLAHKRQKHSAVNHRAVLAPVDNEKSVINKDSRAHKRHSVAYRRAVLAPADSAGKKVKCENPKKRECHHWECHKCHPDGSKEDCCGCDECEHHECHGKDGDCCEHHEEHHCCHHECHGDHDDGDCEECHCCHCCHHCGDCDHDCDHCCCGDCDHCDCDCDHHCCGDCDHCCCHDCDHDCDHDCCHCCHCCHGDDDHGCCCCCDRRSGTHHTGKSPKSKSKAKKVKRERKKRGVSVPIDTPAANVTSEHSNTTTNSTVKCTTGCKRCSNSRDGGCCGLVQPCSARQCMGHHVLGPGHGHIHCPACLLHCPHLNEGHHQVNTNCENIHHGHRMGHAGHPSGCDYVEGHRGCHGLVHHGDLEPLHDHHCHHGHHGHHRHHGGCHDDCGHDSHGPSLDELIHGGDNGHHSCGGHGGHGCGHDCGDDCGHDCGHGCDCGYGNGHDCGYDGGHDCGDCGGHNCGLACDHGNTYNGESDTCAPAHFQTGGHDHHGAKIYVNHECPMGHTGCLTVTPTNGCGCCAPNVLPPSCHQSSAVVKLGCPCEGCPCPCPSCFSVYPCDSDCRIGDAGGYKKHKVTTNENPETFESH